MSSNLLYLQGLSCGGDTISLLNADQPDLPSALGILDINLLWHPSLSRDKGISVSELLDSIIKGDTPLHLLLIEGAVSTPSEDPAAGQWFMDRQFPDWVKALASQAEYTIAIGTCASFGGIPASKDNPTGAMGLQFNREEPGGLLGEGYRSRGGLPVINIPGCPAHPDWIIETLHLIVNGKLTFEALDAANRPFQFYNGLAHHGCPKNEFYEFKSSATEYGQIGCLFEFLGCRGTQCESDCNTRLWLGRTGSCTRGGFPCIACTSQEFPQAGSRFFSTELTGNVPRYLPRDVPKAWYIGITGLSKMATPERLKVNATSSHRIYRLKDRKGD